MATLTYVVQHTLTFRSFVGQDTVWELDLLRGYEGATIPSDFLTTPTSLIGTEEPIEIEWLRDYDVYKPIQGSRATINLVAESEDSFPRFNNAGPFEWQVRLRYRNTANVLTPYWCGFIDQVDGQESVDTFPFVVSFTAVDGLGRLEQSPLPLPAGMTNVTALSQLQSTLIQTGLDLPLLIDSGLRTDTGEAITNVTLNPNFVFQDGENDASLVERRTRKEFLEGFLSAFNCKITQANGRWYVYNASLHGGTGANESNQWQTYEVNPSGDYASVTNITEDLKYTIDGTATQDLIPSNRDLVLNTRRPAGSVECRPSDLRALQLVANTGFTQGSDGFDGYEIPSGALDTSENIVDIPSTVQHPTQDRAIQNRRGRYDISNFPEEVWFQTDFIDVDPTTPFEVSFDHILTQLTTSGGDGYDNARVNYAIEMERTAVVSVVDPSSITNQWDYLNTINNTEPTVAVRTWYWHHGDEEWKTSRSGRSTKGSPTGTIKGEQINKDERNEWKSVSVTCSGLSSWTDISGISKDLLSARARIVFYYGTGQKDNGGSKNRGNRTNHFTQLVTNVKVENTFSNDITSPVFERAQENFTQTLTYEPTFVDETSSQILQRISPDRDNGAESFRLISSLTSTNETLERIVTRLKLNDFRSSFRYYEGTLVNLNTTPFSPINKIGVEWADYTETTSGIFNGGTYRVKSNMFDTAFYIPNQSASAVNPFVAQGDGTTNDSGGIATYGFFPFNIDLIAAPFPGRNRRSVLILPIVVNALNDLGQRLQVVDSMNRAPGDTGYVATYDGLTINEGDGVLTITGNPGDVTSYSVLLTTKAGYDASASNMRWYGGTETDPALFSTLTDEETPDYVSGVTFSDAGPNIRMDFTVTQPETSEFEYLHVAGEVDPFIGDNNRVDLTLAQSTATGQASGITIANTMRPIIAPPGSSIPIQVFITPAVGMQLSSSGLSAPTFTLTGETTATTIVSSTGFSQLGQNIVWEGVVTIPTTVEDTDVDITFSIPSG